jgi:hypothetical protein
MKNLSIFIKDEFIKKNIDSLFENSICIETVEEANRAVSNINRGSCANIIFTSSLVKDRFLDRLKTYRTDINVINCNSTISSFFENDFGGFLVFNNLTRCKHVEIIEEIKKHKAILLC